MTWDSGVDTVGETQGVLGGEICDGAFRFVVARRHQKRGESFVIRTDSLTEDLRRKHIRSAGRVNSRVALTVEWQEGGKTLQTTGYTVDVSVRGCMAVIEQGFPVGQKMRVTNGANGKSAEATVVWRGHEGRKGWEMGLELDGEDGDFWGLEF